MRIQPNGDFKVKAGETITVKVQGSGTVYLAAFSDPSYGNWIPVSPPNPEVRSLIVAAVPVNSFDLAFHFQPAAAPANYHVTIVGDPAEDTFEEDVPPLPPLPAGRDYTLITG